jgi:hypothetical protein
MTPVDPFRPHTITVYPQIEGRDSKNKPTYSDGAPVQVIGKMRPRISTENNGGAGVNLETVWSFSTTDPYPGGTRTRVEWDGRKFDQLADALPNVIGLETDNTIVMLIQTGQVIQ